jgi:N6-adenosine-specific RNA methylase IME4
MNEEKRSPAGRGRAEEVCTDKTNSPPTPSTQENSLTTLTRNKYGAIRVEPPWSVRNWSAKRTGRNAIFHYETLEEMVALPIGDLAANNCALFLWGVDPLLDEAFELIRTWGFEYKAIGYWVDQNTKGESFFTGPGSWTKASPERCLLATRGKPKRWAKDVPSLVIAPRREHSCKPDEVREADRAARGDQAGLLDQGTVVTRRQPSRDHSRSPHEFKSVTHGR